MITFKGKPVKIKEIIDYNLRIINDNYGYGLLHSYEYTQKECDDYWDEATDELGKLDAYLYNNKQAPIELIVDEETELFRVKKKDEKDNGCFPNSIFLHD